MRNVVVGLAIGTAAFFGTMLDNFFAFTAQLLVTDHAHQRKVARAHVAGVVTLIVASGVLGAALTFLPLRWSALLALAPLALAVHAWRGHTESLATNRRGAVTTFLVTVGLGGDNLAVWIPLLRTQSVTRGVTVAVTLFLLDLGLVVLARRVVRLPRVVAVGERWSQRLMPWLYVALAGLIVWQCGWFSFLG